MPSVYAAALITAVPFQELLFTVGVFLLAALVLFALSVEAGNYPNISAGIQRTRHSLRRLRHRCWHGESISA